MPWSAVPMGPAVDLGTTKIGAYLMDLTTGISHEEVAAVFIAGTFGSYINLANAVRIGLLPVFPNAEHHQIENAAAVGAKQALVDRSGREQAARIAEESRHVDLTRHKKFNRYFAEGMLFPEPDQIKPF